MPHSLELQVHEENILAGAWNSYGFPSNHFVSPDCVSTLCILPRRMSGRYSLCVRIRHHPRSREVPKLTLEGTYSPRDPK